jgi:glucokinase
LRKQSPTIAALGVGVPGLVNPQTQRVEVSSDIPSLTEHDFRAEVESLTGIPVTLANDANAAAFAEYTTGAGRDARSMFYALIGKGIGGALILDGKLWTGASGYAGEFGYIAIDAEGGVLESVASAPNIVRRTQERLFRDGTSSLSRLAMNPAFKAADIAREAANGDDFALLMIERTGRYIGTAVASVINLLNVERIVLGGGVISEAGDLIIAPITSEAAKRSFQPCFQATTISAAALGADAVPIGAAMLARDAAR